MNKPKVFIPLESWRSLMAYVSLCDTEITGFFDVDYDPEDHAFIVGKVYLVDQEAGAAHVEMDEDVLADFSYQLIKQGAEQLPRGWWHSHVNMQAFFSGTDDQTINTDFRNDTFTVSIVLNKRREYKASCVIWQMPPDNILTTIYEVKGNVRFDDLEIEIINEYSEIPKSIEREIKKKVKPPKPVTPSIWSGYGGHNHQSNMDLSEKKSGKELLKTKIDGKHPKSLPKDPIEALERIDSLGLVRMWKSEIRTFVYFDVDTEDIWLDVWGVVDFDTYTQMKGRDDTDRSELTRQWTNPQTERCLNCQYMRSVHSEDYCSSELYESDFSTDERKTIAGLIGSADDDDDPDHWRSDK